MSQTSIRFLADADLRGVIVSGLRRRQPVIDMLTASEGGVIGIPDGEVLTIAANLGRILVSHDVNTMPERFKTFLAQGHHSPGLILVHQKTSTVEAIEVLHIAWGASTPEDWYDIYAPFA